MSIANIQQGAPDAANANYGAFGSLKSKMAGQTIGRGTTDTKPLALEQYPRWAEMVHHTLEVAPPAFYRQSATLLLGILQLVYEHTPCAWSLTVLEGNPILAPQHCKESRHHLQKNATGWDWQVKHRRRHQANHSTLQQLLQPATVADHALLMRSDAMGPFALYRWGEEGYIAIVNIAGVTIGIRDVPGVGESNEILICREAFEHNTLDKLDGEFLFNLFGREEEAGDACQEPPVNLIDDAGEGMTGVPTVFFHHSASADRSKGIINVVMQRIKHAGKGCEKSVWHSFRASDQHRFNQERLRTLIIPKLFEGADNQLRGAAAADVMLLIGIARRLETAAKTVDAPGQVNLVQIAIKLAAHYLEDLHNARRDDTDAIEERLNLLGQIWIHTTGKIPYWLPEKSSKELQNTLNDFFHRILKNSEGRGPATSRPSRQ